jgi:hypothetical protein
MDRTAFSPSNAPRRMLNSEKHKYEETKLFYQGCESGMFIPDPNFSIPDPDQVF